MSYDHDSSDEECDDFLGSTGSFSSNQPPSGTEFNARPDLVYRSAPVATYMPSQVSRLGPSQRPVERESAINGGNRGRGVRGGFEPVTPPTFILSTPNRSDRDYSPDSQTFPPFERNTIISPPTSANPSFDIGEDSDSEEDVDPETERLRRREAAISSARVNLRCMNDDCALEPWMVQPPRLQRQKACLYQELVRLPCECCGRSIETTIRYQAPAC